MPTQHEPGGNVLNHAQTCAIRQQPISCRSDSSSHVLSGPGRTRLDGPATALSVPTHFHNLVS